MAVIERQEVAIMINLFHNFIPHNSCKMLLVRVVKEFDLYELRANVPSCPRGSSVPAGNSAKGLLWDLKLP